MDEQLRELEREARRRVAEVRDDPQGRYRLREAFYRKHGGTGLEPYGFGASELSFLRYEIERGVLNPLSGATPGSPWWRGVNGEFLYFSELAGLVFEAGLAAAEVGHEVRLWLDYIQVPSAAAWYRAHNASIVRGYLDTVREARAEQRIEQIFMNDVLYRLLYAEALVTGVALGEIGAVIANPLLPAVDILVHLPAFYPRHYPMTADEALDVEHKGIGIDETLARLLDQVLILPHLARLYHLTARQLGIPELVALIRDGKPIYPDLSVPPPPPAGPPRKVLILGGGSAALAAAWELTRHPGWRERYEVTVMTMGFRVGGKTATGRGPFQRVEEHGIHILQGWYDLTFKLLRRVYDERRELRLDPRAPFQRWQDGFERNDSTLLTEYIAGRGWVNWPLIFPSNDATPGEGPPLSTWQLIKKLVALALEQLLGSPYQEGLGPLPRWLLDHFFPPEGLAHRAARWLEPLLSHGEAEAQMLPHVLGLVERLDEPGEGVADTLLALMDGAVDWMQERVDEREPRHDRLRRILLLVELVVVNLRGVLADVWDHHTGNFDWSRIDGEDYRAWIKRHGASARALGSTPVRFFYTGTFANLVGRPDQGGRIAAGTALRFVLASAGYKGSFVYQFRAGTGDTLIMPIYEVLLARGVKFELFHEVQSVHGSTSGAIEKVTVGRQVTMRAGDYEPTIRVGRLRAWPAHPLYDQINRAQADELRRREIDLESPWTDWVCPEVKTLERGRDFDELVLAIPVATLKTICAELCAQDERWREMVDGVQTTATMAMQLWLTPTLAGLGFDRGAWGLAPERCAPNVVVYQSPMYSWLDSTLVRWTERWPTPPGTIAYFTGSMSDPARVPPFSDTSYPRLARERVEALSTQWLWDNMGWFWPAGERPEAPNGLDPTLLLGPTERASAAERLSFQVYRANVDPWQRYTLSVPGSARHRLRADGSGYVNLWLAGDWIDFGMNVGYIEGALTSGVQAARALRKGLGLIDADDLGAEAR